jgi:hypothetical protein
VLLRFPLRQYPLAGTYTIQAQAVSSCDFATLTPAITVTTSCNAPARFVCGVPNSLVVASVASSCSGASGGPFADPTAVYPTTVQYNCAEGMFQPVFLSMGGDSGGDVASAGDPLTFTASITSPPATSWWSKAYVFATVSWTIQVADTPANLASLLEDGIG